MANTMCRGIKAALKTYEELSIPTVPALGPSAESWVPTAPLQGRLCRLQCHSSGRTEKAEVAVLALHPEGRKVLCVLSAGYKQGLKHHGQEPVPFTSSRHLPGNIQGKSPTSATSPVLEMFFIPFIAIIPSSF